MLTAVFSVDKQYGRGKKKYPDIRKGVDGSLHGRWNEKQTAEGKVLPKDCLQSQSVAYYKHIYVEWFELFITVFSVDFIQRLHVK